jgi:hypothetical protein
MLTMLAFDELAIVMGDLYFIDPAPNEGQETPERGVRIELRLVSRDAPAGGIYASIPISIGRPIWRIDFLEAAGGPVGSLDRAHHHPRFTGWEPGPRVFVPELSANPIGWLTQELADVDAVLDRAGCEPDLVSFQDRLALSAATPKILAEVRDLLDGVYAGRLAPAPAQPVAAARTGWL